MPKNAETGVDESDPNKTAGNGSEGAADPALEGLKAALKAEREKRQGVETKLARLEGTVEGLKGSHQPKPEAPAIWTRAQLRAKVNAGEITEDVMDATLEQQLRAEVKRDITTTAVETAKVTRAAAQIGSEIAAYMEAHPDLTDEGSDLRAKVQDEFDYLCRLGDNPEDKATELKAIRAAVGPITPKGRRKQPETHQETGGSGGDGRDRNDTDATWAKGLTAAQKAHYQKQIDRGGYSGPTDKRLVAEVKIARERRAAH